ncbi:hypothetical protein E4U31_005712 [Claviceps sp. LM219 group G6]|uniref:Uncharacterized protein n=1 Tax=Claviceps pazoutovae TaxID=1649127 RepID=A0A9P7M7L7_9HYPO|nr:hypothetical protein E4U61_001267 [Claviceps capensis]KAG5931996.1 hypothetical protein E4U60_005552 [Claviceps pazoutovae]KAG6086604.1 hypothetical protein E4U15_000560 [Claviceps sp. LM218 group G6]KAG6095714.1 hypothetical protein E4U31_005712 [Claviceps sp. LM219 group G6]
MAIESSPLLAEPASETSYPTAYDAKSIETSYSSTSCSSSSSRPFDYGPLLRDIIIGFSDGLTVPFALTAGLSSLGSTKLVIMGGLAELFSGMISMGLGAYLAAATERDTFTSQASMQHAHNATRGVEERRAEIYSILLDRYGLSRKSVKPLVDELCADSERWARFKTDFGCGGGEEPSVHRAWVSGLTMGVSYFLGGLIPMIPYFVLENVANALVVSVAVTVVVLLAFGYVKNYVAIRNHRAGLWGAAQTLVIGVLAAGTSYVIVKGLDRGTD